MGTPRPTRTQCVAAFGAWFAQARRNRDTLPVTEAARRALRPGGPSLAELESRIAARRRTAVAA
jgi:hypothetical protein